MSMNTSHNTSSNTTGTPNLGGSHAVGSGTLGAGNAANQNKGRLGIGGMGAGNNGGAAGASTANGRGVNSKDNKQKLEEGALVASGSTGRFDAHEYGYSDYGRSGRLFTTLLFAVITLFLMVAFLVGMNAYRSTDNMRTDADEMRLGLSLISNSVHTNDMTDAVGVAQGPEGPALVLTEHADNGTYETRLYLYQGNVMEEYSRAHSAFTPDRAREVVASESFDFEYKTVY